MCRTFCFCLSFLSIIAHTVQAEHRVFVEQGVSRNVSVRGTAWESRDGALLGAGTGTLLFAGNPLGAGDFTAALRLSIHDLDGSAASVMINSSQLGFAGKQDEMFTEGPLFGGMDPW